MRPSARRARADLSQVTWVVVVCGLALGAGLLWPHGGPAADTAPAEYGLAFFGALLTAEAVVFALSFDPSTRWPSLREIDRHVALRVWLTIGATGALLLVVGLMTDQDALVRASAVALLAADVIGMLSFLRLFRLAGADGRRRLLRRTLTTELGRRGTTGPAGVATSPVLSAYLGELDAALGRGDNAAIAELFSQLSGLEVRAESMAGVARIHLSALGRTCRATLVNGLDGTVASGAITSTTASLAGYTYRFGPLSDGRTETAALAHLTRYLAWLTNCSLELRGQGAVGQLVAHEVLTASSAARADLLRVFDPEPAGPGAGELYSPARDVVAALAMIRMFTEYHGEHQATAMYPFHQLLTGRRFLGNHFDGGLVLESLRAHLVDGVHDPAVWARPDVGQLDRALVRVSANALALLRERAVGRAPELARPASVDDRRLLAAIVRTYAGHRCVADADDALGLLSSLVARQDRPEGIWYRSTVLLSAPDLQLGLPLGHPRDRLPGLVLSLLVRLLPMSAAGSSHEAERFLAAFPSSVRDAVDRLALRICGADGAPTGAIDAMAFVREAPADVR